MCVLVGVHVGCAQALDRLLVHQRLASADPTSQFFPRLLEVGRIPCTHWRPPCPLGAPPLALSCSVLQPQPPSAILPMAVPSMPPVRRTVSEIVRRWQCFSRSSVACGLALTVPWSARRIQSVPTRGRVCGAPEGGLQSIRRTQYTQRSVRTEGLPQAWLPTLHCTVSTHGRSSGCTSASSGSKS